MKLEEKEYYEYLDIHPKLLLYAGIKNKILSPKTSLKDFRDFPAKEKFPSRESLYENIELIDQFIEEYSAELSAQQIDMLQ